MSIDIPWTAHCFTILWVIFITALTFTSVIVMAAGIFMAVQVSRILHYRAEQYEQAVAPNV